MAKNLTTGQIAQLIEIDRARDGIHSEVQALIDCLISGGVGVDLRFRQAKALWDKGWGRELGFKSFLDYLATIPRIPEFPAEGDRLFDRVILVDMRVASLTKQCELLGVRYSECYGKVYKSHSQEKTRTGVYWMRCHDGKRNRDKSPKDSRKSFASFEIGCSVFEGLAIFAQDFSIIDGYMMDLPGSIDVTDSRFVACLGRHGAWSGLGSRPDNDASPKCGSASRQN